MLKFCITILLIVTQTSCKSLAEKADDLRLDNKFTEAAELYQEAANHGDAYAKWRLARAYGIGDGVEFDNDKYITLLKEASDAGCEQATCDLAYTYIFGWSGVVKDKNKGVGMLTDLMEHSDNSYVLSRCAIYKLETEPELALSILERVKDKHDPLYLRAMGLVYQKGIMNIDKDINKAIEYYTKAFENGDKSSANTIASLYWHGNGVKHDMNKARLWAEKGTESNDPSSMMLLSAIYLMPDTDFQNINKGIYLLEQAGKHGNGFAYYTLGHLYMYGDNVSKDDTKAFEYFTKSTALGDESGAFCLGLMYMYGIGCEKNAENGVRVWEKAVELGDGGAANNLYCYYLGDYGNFKNRNKELAKQYLLKSAQLEDAKGCLNLGYAYRYGRDLFEENKTQAFIYIKKAADLGDVDACEELSNMYERGIGCERNPTAAEKYRNKTKAKAKENLIK